MMEGSSAPRDIERHVQPDDHTIAAGSPGAPLTQVFHIYNGPVNNVETAVGSNFGLNYGHIEYCGQAQLPPSSSEPFASGSGGLASQGPSPSAGLVIPHTSSLSALLDPITNASHTRDRALSPPNSRCFEGTRKKVLKKIRSWFDGTLLFGNPHIMWIYGYAGCGKSAIAQLVSEEISSEGRLAGSFFFFRGSGDRDRITKFATTVASQLAATVPSTEPIIMAAINATPSLRSTDLTAVGAQFQHLVYEPLNACTVGWDRVTASINRKAFLIVLDGVDECEDKEQIAAFIEHMVNFFNKNPLTPLRFLITSRVENHLYQRLRSSKQVKLMDLVMHTSDTDIATALDVAIANEKCGLSYACEASWPCEEDKKKLVEHIGGSYIFLTTLIKLLFDQSGDDEETPMQRLSKLLDVRPDFDSLYKQTLEKSRRLLHFQDIISVIALAREPLSIIQIAELLNIETFLVSRVLVNLHAIMQVPGDDQSPVILWHTSLRDFLLSRNRAGAFFASQKTLAFACASASLSPSHSAFQYSDRYLVVHWLNLLTSASQQEQVDVDTTFGSDGQTILQIAVNKKEWQLFQALVHVGANMKPHFMAIHSCAKDGNDNMVLFMLEHGADPNIKDLYGDTPLHKAAPWGHIKVMRHLLEFGADPNIMNEFGWTPLFWVRLRGHVEAERLLLDYNADPSIKKKKSDPPSKFKTPIPRGIGIIPDLIAHHQRRVMLNERAMGTASTPTRRRPLANFDYTHSETSSECMPSGSNIPSPDVCTNE